MPAGDGTGPWGYGPMTGRGAGFCAGYSAPGFMNPGASRGWSPGFGRGFGRGGGRGFRNRFYATGLTGWQRGAYPWPGPGGMPSYPAHASAPTREEELGALKGQAEYLESALSDIKTRIAELERDTKA